MDTGAQVLVLTGDAGIGKTRLAEELCTFAAHHGGTTALATCHNAEGVLPFAAVIELASLKRSAEAVEPLERALQLYESGHHVFAAADALISLCGVYVDIGRASLAHDRLRPLIELLEVNREGFLRSHQAWYVYSRALAALQRPQEAREALNRAAAQLRELVRGLSLEADRLAVQQRIALNREILEMAGASPYLSDAPSTRPQRDDTLA